MATVVDWTPEDVKVAVPRRSSPFVDPMGETLLDGFRYVDKVTDETGPMNSLAVKELWNESIPSGAVMPVSVTQRNRVRVVLPLLWGIVLESKKPELSGGVPVAVAVTV